MSAAAEALKEPGVRTAEELVDAVIIGPEAYISPEYVHAERDRLWRKVWLQAGRAEEVPEVGNFITYDILDDSLIVIRTAADRIRAYYNVCSHRGRRLVDTPEGEKRACGKRKNFTCGYHGWTYGIDGKCVNIPLQDDWKGMLNEERTRLTEVKCDTWGGWVWINQDPDAGSLREYLEPAAGMLDPFKLENMRCKWRKWLTVDCNWKVAMEAFYETYHVPTTHPEFMQFGVYAGWARAQDKHSNIGYEAPKGLDETQSKIRLGAGDPRTSTAVMQNYIMKHVNAVTTQTMADVANRLADELPEGTPAEKVLKHWLDSSKRIDAERGAPWPEVDPAHVAKSGTAWQIFPNFQIGHALNNALCYSARPHGYDPNKCIFEVAVYEIYPKGQEPKAEWEYTPLGDPRWLSVLPQDFSNMAAVQQGMRSGGFRGNMPNPHREQSVSNLHRNLARYMGTGAPRKLK